jgi:hypothetical protein
MAWTSGSTASINGWKGCHIDDRLNGMDQRLNRVDQRLEGMDQRFEGVDQHLDRQDADTEQRTMNLLLTIEAEGKESRRYADQLFAIVDGQHLLAENTPTAPKPTGRLRPVRKGGR